MTRSNGHREQEEAPIKDPATQYKRERSALLKTLQAGKVLPDKDPDTWLHGGLVFTHPNARYYIYHPDCEYGEVLDWSQKMINHSSAVALTLEQRLQIADCILSKAENLGDFPNEIKDAKAIAETSIEEIVQGLKASSYLNRVEEYVSETEEFVAKYQAFAISDVQIHEP